MDTHIYGVSNRNEPALGKNADKVEEKLLKVVPVELKVDVHNGLFYMAIIPVWPVNPGAAHALLKTGASLKIRPSKPQIQIIIAY